MSLVVFRADGGPAIGAGHVMRDLALASVFADGGWSIGFAGDGETFASVAALRDLHHQKLVLATHGRDEAEAEAMRRKWPGGADVFVVDHYGRDTRLEQACRGWARRIVVIDDLADRRHDCDVLVDVANDRSAYRGLVPDRCDVLTGAGHAIVHPAFRSARAAALARRDGRAVERVLVSFGQVDAANATLHALRALESIGFSGSIDVMLGRAAPHLAGVQAAARGEVNLHIDVPAANVPRLMSEADLAVGAGGVTALERCCLGLPSIVAVLAENQSRIAAMLCNAGAAVDAGRVDAEFEARLADRLRSVLAGHEQRAAMARAGAALVDGRGAERILLAAIGSIHTKERHAVRLRCASDADEAWLLALQSRSETRRFANNPVAPSQQAHRDWLAATLADPSRLLMIAEVDGRAAGMLRLDRQARGERINIAVDPQYYRKGVGTAMLALAARMRPYGVVEAEILPGNDASLALFAAAGYRQVEERLYRREPE